MLITKFQLKRIVDIGPENIRAIEMRTDVIVNGLDEVNVRYDVVMNDGTIYEFKNWNWQNYSKPLTETVKGKLTKQIDTYAKANSKVVLEFAGVYPQWAKNLETMYNNLTVRAISF